MPSAEPLDPPRPCLTVLDVVQPARQVELREENRWENGHEAERWSAKYSCCFLYAQVLTLR
jgi:hypothetical protein